MLEDIIVNDDELAPVLGNELSHSLLDTKKREVKLNSSQLLFPRYHTTIQLLIQSWVWKRAM